jgi:hypothetical protein
MLARTQRARAEHDLLPRRDGDDDVGGKRLVTRYDSSTYPVRNVARAGFVDVPQHDRVSTRV